MKMSLSQLKQVIREEVQRLNEMPKRPPKKLPLKPAEARWFEYEREGYRAIVQFMDDVVEIVHQDRMRKDVDPEYREEARDEYEYFTDALEGFEEEVYHACAGGDTSSIDQYEVIDIAGTPKVVNEQLLAEMPKRKRDSKPSVTVGELEMIEDEETAEEFVDRCVKAGIKARVVGYGPGSGMATIEVGHDDPAVLKAFCDREMGEGAYEDLFPPGTLATM